MKRRNDSRSNALAALQDLARLLTATRRLSGVLNTVVLAQRAAQEVHSLVPADIAFVNIRENSRLLCVRGVSGERTSQILGTDVSIGSGLAGKVLAVRHPLSVADYEWDPGITREFVDMMVHGVGVRGFAGFPIEYGDDIVGVLCAGIRSVGHLDGRTQLLLMELSRSLGPLVGSALQSDSAVRLSVEAERQRIAMELHDNLGQTLFGIGVSARKARASVPAEAMGVAVELSDIEAQTSRAASHLRDTLRSLTPSPPEDSLSTIIHMDVEDFSHRTGVPAHLVVMGERFRLPSAVETTILSLVREGLHNVEKHAAAATVILTLYYGESEAEIVLQDDGRGLPSDPELERVHRTGERLGLASLLQRVERLGGRLTLTRNEDRGLTLRAAFPIQVENRVS